MSIGKLLEELNTYWHANPDEQFWGEHPECEKIQNILYERFCKLSDEELYSILKDSDEDRLDQLSAVLVQLMAQRPVVSEFVRL